MSISQDSVGDRTDFEHLIAAGTNNLKGLFDRVHLIESETADGTGFISGWKRVGEPRDVYRQQLIQRLGVDVPADAVKAFGLGFAPVAYANGGGTLAFLFPERSPEGTFVGISYRRMSDDKKLSVTGSKRGFIYPLAPDYRPYTSGSQNWIRTTDAGLPCPICGKGDGCLLSRDDLANPAAVICCRTPSPSRCGIGHLHRRKPEVRPGGSSPLRNIGGVVLIVEGASDAIAGFVLGFDTVGVPSAYADSTPLVDLCKGRDVVVVGENDQKADGTWVGKDAAERRVKVLRDAGLNAKLVMPPPGIKDLRAWAINRKLTHEDLTSFIEREARIVEGPQKSHGDSVAKKVVAKARAEDSFFHDGSEAYVLTQAGGTFDVGGTDYRELLVQRTFEAEETVPTSQALVDAQATLTAYAKYRSPAGKVHLRVAVDGDTRFIDLGNESRSVVRVTRDGWTILPFAESPVRFIRRPGMQALPTPTPGGDIRELRPFVNLSDGDWLIFVGWLLSIYIDQGTLPILGIRGQQDSGKTLIARIARVFTDPNDVPLRLMPESERDFAVGARNALVMAFDNLSHVSPAMSDLLCSTATGGGFAKRKNYSDGDEARYSFKRSIILNGIASGVYAREDLRSRCVIVRPQPIDAKRRLLENELWGRVNAVLPSVFGALLDALSGALGRLADVQPDRQGRLGDWSKLVVAAERSLRFPPGAFLAALKDDQTEAAASTAENSVVVQTVLRLLDAGGGTWRGAMGDLFAETMRPGGGFLQRDLPQSARGLRDALDRALPALRACGVLFIEATNNRRVHTFTRDRGLS